MKLPVLAEVFDRDTYGAVSRVVEGDITGWGAGARVVLSHRWSNYGS
jgi:hypothetical protein